MGWYMIFANYEPVYDLCKFYGMNRIITFDNLTRMLKDIKTFPY